MHSATEDILYIKKVLAGDTEAYRFIVSRYKSYIFTLLIRMLKVREEAEEANQDVFLKAYKSLKHFKGSAKFSTWLYRIAYHEALDRLKKKSKQPDVVSFDLQHEHDVDVINEELDEMEYTIRSQLLNSCIKELSSEDSFIITAYYLNEVSSAEIAQMMNISKNNVKVKLFRSRRRLASIILSKTKITNLVL